MSSVSVIMSKQIFGNDPDKPVAHPPWVNPCNLPIYIYPSQDSQPSVKDMYEKITRRATAAKGLSEKLKTQFVSNPVFYSKYLILRIYKVSF